VGLVMSCGASSNAFINNFEKVVLPTPRSPLKHITDSDFKVLERSAAISESCDMVQFAILFSIVK
jgi:hypothetical protein